MELAKIEILIESYFDGNTTLEEERILKKYFAQEVAPTHLQEYKLMFDYFGQSKTEVSNQPIQVKPIKKTWNKSWLSIAAAVILLFTIYKIIPTADGFTKAERVEAQKAYVESQKAFQLISKSLNRGNNKIAYLQDYKTTKNKIFKTTN